MHTLINLILLPFRTLWNIIVLLGAIIAQVAWISFLLGSVLGIVLILLFNPGLLLFPLSLLYLSTDYWPDAK